jgi:hypothetical protein
MAQSGTSGSYNPYLIQGTLTPAPLPPTEFGGGGTLLFDVGNTGSSDLPAVANQEMRLTITLSRMVPATADPLAAIGGEGAAWFHWSYDSSIRTYTGTQKTTIPGNSRKTVTIAAKVAENSFQPASNGFNVNLQPPPYANPQPTDDDTVSSYTYVAAEVSGDAPASADYGKGTHTIDVSTGAGGYKQYMFLGASVLKRDGVAIPALRRGETPEVTVTFTVKDWDASVAGRYLNLWIDWNGNGTLEPTERVLNNYDLSEVVPGSPGGERATAAVPIQISATAVTTLPVYARFRFGPFISNATTNRPRAPYTTVAYGEVEDYLVRVLEPLGNPPQLGYSDWSAGFGGAGVIGGPTDDPDGDGRKNAEEYALGTHPLMPDATASYQWTRETVRGLTYRGLWIPRTPGRPKAVLTPEVSAELVHWLTAPEHLEILLDEPDVLWFRDRSAEEDHPRRFYRVRTTVQP